MAAGIGSRMNPVTLTIPKPLIKVNGKIMIETIIDGLHNQGIYEIYIVVGYLKEQFSFLSEKYNGVTIIENPYYNKCNNISSLYVARDYLDDVIILDGDQIIYNDNILNRYFDKSGYNAVWTSEETSEWLLDVDGTDTIVNCHRDGGHEGWILYSISRWSHEDGMRLKKHLEREFEEKCNRQIYWDDVAMFCYPDEYKLGIYRMQISDVLEIDRFSELVEIDKSYENYGGENHESI